MILRMRLISRQFARNPQQAFLSVLGIALAVAVVLSIDLVNASAVRSFEHSRQSLLGSRTHQITGNMAALDESFYVHLRRDLGVARAFPVVEGSVVTANGFTLAVIGIDPVTALEGGALARESLPDLPLASIMRKDTVILSEETARRLDTEVPGSLLLDIGGSAHPVEVVGTFAPGDALRAETLEDTLVADIATAQELLGMQGRLRRIDLELTPGQARELSKRMPPHLALTENSRQGDAMEQMTRAFRVNLTALSLLALLIGAFLIYNSMILSVLKRRSLIATLRTIGLSRAELLGLVLGEALLLAVAGIALGTLLGIGLADRLLLLASRTIDDLYYAAEVTRLHPDPVSFLKAYALALFATLAAAAHPAAEAVGIPPELGRSRSRIERRTIESHPRLALSSLLFAAVAGALVAFSGHSIVAGFAALFCIVIAVASLLPMLTRILISMATEPLRALLGSTGTIACRGLIASMSRTQVAITALTIAISATVSVSIMIGSFRGSVEAWLQSYLRADVYVTQTDARTGTGLPEDLIERVRRDPEVAAIHTIRWRSLIADDLAADLYVIGVERDQFHNYQFIARARESLWPRFCCSDSVIVSEPYAYRHDTHVGDSITLTTPQGPRPFQVLGIYRDYLSDGGIVTMHKDVYEHWWHEERVMSLAIYLKEGASPGQVADRLSLEFRTVRVRSTRALRDAALAIFDRTFSITEVLRTLSVVIAIVGVLGALTAIESERGTDFILLRVAGVTRLGLARLILTESGLMGLLAGVLAIPLGTLMALVIIDVINRRSFGWSMDLAIEPGYILLSLLLGIASGMVAGVIPAWSIARSRLAAGLRHA